MAKKRMFANDIINSEGFYTLSNDAKLAYLYLNMGADDDGFVATAAKELFPIRLNAESVLEELVSKGYLFKFDSPKVYVIVHFFVHNMKRKDRYTPTYYSEIRSRLTLDKNGKYVLLEASEPSDVEQLSVLVATNKSKVNKSKLDESIDISTEPGNPPDSMHPDVDGIPCIDGSIWYPTETMYNKFVNLYSGLDIKREFAKMAIWCDANPKRKKTRSGCARFVSGWLERSQNSGWGIARGNQQRAQPQKISYVESVQEANKQNDIDEEEEIRKTMEKLARIRREEAQDV